MSGKSIRRNLKRFGVELLCLLMVLYGAPLQALGAGGQEDREFEAAPPDPPSSKDATTRGDADRDDTVREDRTQSAEAAEAFETAVAARDYLEGIPLYPGYNLVSLPEEPPDPNPATVFAPIAGSYVEVFAHDVCDQDDEDGWQIYDPTDPASSDLLDVDPTQGLWIEATAPAVLPSDGTLPATTSWQLCQGWNLIGFPAAQPRPVRSALQSIDGKYIRIFGYDASDSDDPWEIWDANVPDWANDLRELRPGFGYWLLVTEDVTLEIANEGEPPAVAFTAPADLAEVTAPTEIRGTVESQLLDSWSLAYRFAGETEWTELGSGNVPVADGSLATFDPTLLLNGLYEIRLRAVDFAGTAVEETMAVVVDGQMKIGHFTLSFIDLAIPLSGLDVEVVRTYDSRQKDLQGDFGHGWTLDVRQGSYRNNRPPGDGWQLAEGFVPCDTALESKSHLTVVRLSEREIYRFALRLVDGAPSTGGGCFARAEFEYVDGPIPGATLEILGNDQVFQETESADRVFDVDTLDVYEPQGVRLTTRDGRVFDLGLDRGVTRVEDPNGNELEIREEGIFHSAGKSVDFERDAAGRITKITDPAGHDVVYDYEAAGDLVSTTDPVGNVTGFAYDGDHRLVDVVDPKGVRAIRSEYDPDGRLIRITDALGQELQLSHDLDARREVVTNRLGLVRVLEYDSRGNVVRETDELGHVTTRSYDAKDRLLTETDPLGNTTTNTYNVDGDLVSVTAPLGNTTGFSYDERGNPKKITDPRGKVTTLTYDSRGNLTSITDPLGGVTTLEYDARGQLLSETDALGHVTSFAYDAAGNPVRTTDALGTETTSTFDENGHLTSRATTRTLPDGSTETLTTTFTVDELGRVTSTTLPDGATTSTTYDPLGAVLSTTDPLGRVTTFSYDAAGRQTEVVHPDGTMEDRAYDAEGRLVAATDRAGRVTSFTYDATGRLLSTEHPDGTTTSSSYDDAGRLVATTDGRGFTTVYTYDKAGRRTEVTDPLGNTTAFVYDAAGNQTAVTDALDNTTAFTFDDAGRLVTTTFPDDTTTSNVYDALGRRVAEVDQAGVETGFGYDPLGRLVEVTDALGGVTRYSYDEQVNRTSQTDANGHTTRFTYDRVGRRTSRTLPGGATESFTYDAAGNRASRTDFNGATTVYSYDDNDRLIGRSYPDGSSVSFTYTPTGRRATVTDARGVTQYSYDDRGRLVTMSAPEGWTLRYAWDATGNRTAVTADLGDQGLHTTAYTFDALGRMATVTDARGGAYEYGYDAADRRSSLSYPNGVVTSYEHDAVGRLVDLHTEAPDGTVIQDYAYALGPTGNRQSVTEEGGTVRSWEYDELYRLTRERVTDGDGALVYENAFTYDPVGNRTEQVRTAADGSVETLVYDYDARDRLSSESVTGGGATSYGWDANGNLTSESGPEGTAVYGWDFENRLVSVELADGTVVGNRYDTDGVRMASELTPLGGPNSKTGYVTDTSGPLSQVIAEIDGTSVLGVHYARGEQLLGLLREGQEKYAHGDHIESVRALTESDAAVEDTYTYEAFGSALTHDGNDPNQILFTGEQRSAPIGLHYLRARWMDPSLGRFISEDPLKDSLPFSKRLHPYTYADLNPANRVDPSGLITVAESLNVNLAQAILSIAATAVAVCAVGAVGAAAGATSGTGCSNDDDNLTFYRGTNWYPALHIITSQTLASDLPRIIANQKTWPPHRQGIYLTSQVGTAIYYADVERNRGGGPAVIQIEVEKTEFQLLTARYNIQVEAPVPDPPQTGQTETLIPYAAIPEFDFIAFYKITPF